MIYAYDQYAQMPVRDLYDSAIMQMAIGAAKDMYDTRRKDFKEFKEKYADFYSPFQKDMQRYGEMMDYVKSKVDDAYAKGIDILRSPEGRGILDRITNSIDPAEYNMMRHNAKVGEAYQVALAKLRSEGKFSQDMEDYRLRSLGIPSFDEFSTYGKNGLNAWGEYSPVQYKGLQELTEDWYDKRTPYQLSADKAKEVLGKSYDPRYKYTGFLDEDLMKIAGDKTPGWQGSFYSDYYRDLARKQVAAEGGNPNDKNAVESRLQRNVADSQQKWLVNPIGSIDDWYKIQSVYNGRRSSGGSGSSNNASPEKTSYGLTLFTRGLQHHVGGSDAIQTQKDAYNFGRAAAKLVTQGKTTKLANNSAQMGMLNTAFVNRYGRKNVETQQTFNNRFDKNQIVDGLVVMDESMLPRLYHPQEVFTNTLGYPAKNVVHTNRTALENFMNKKDKDGNRLPVNIVVKGGDYTSPTKKHNYEQFVDVVLIRADGAKQNMEFKIYETDPVATTPDKDGDQIAIGGYSLLPSQNSTNWWSQEDHRQNQAAGLAAEKVRQQQGEVLDTNF